MWVPLLTPMSPGIPPIIAFADTAPSAGGGGAPYAVSLLSSPFPLGDLLCIFLAKCMSP